MKNLVSALLLFFYFSSFGQSEEPGALELKTIELEWEAVENADGYEVRLTPETGKQIFFKTADSKLSEQVPVGVYSLRIRSKHKESSDLWSPWSDAIRLEVLKKELQLLEPQNEVVLTANSNKREEVAFKWSEVAKAKTYTLQIWDEQTKEKPLTFITKKNSQRLKLLPGRVYFWQVTFESSTAVNYVQVIKTNMFTIQGARLVKPSIHAFKTGAEQKVLSWISSKQAKSHSVKLFFRYLDEEKWTQVNTAEVPTVMWEFGKLKPGMYKLEVIAHAPKHTSSEPGSYEFLVKPKRAELESELQRIEL